MLPPGLTTPRQVHAHYDSVYFAQIESRYGFPFLYPWAGLGAMVAFAYLMIDHRRSKVLKAFRWPVFAFLCCYQGWCIVTNRARNPAVSFGVGLLSSWGVLWVAAVMIVNDCQSDFKRVERAPRFLNTRMNESQSDGTASNGTATAPHSEANARQREPGTTLIDRTPLKPYDNGSKKFFWQRYPDGPFLARIDWVADVFCSFRGVGWNFQTSGVPPLPLSVKAQLENDDNVTGGDAEMTTSRTGIRRYSDRTTLVKDTFQNLVLGYFLLDLIKCLMAQDPYFLGYVNDTSGPNYLPAIIRESYALLKTYRLLVCLAGIYTALWEIFKLGPLFFCGLLGPRWLGLRGKAWMNPADMFGSYSVVLDKGLAGWWAGWWHQTFRLAFEGPATRIMQALQIQKKSVLGKAISLLVAFFLSGCLHACGSYTQLGDTRPLLGPMRFFLLQAVGILVQTTAITWLEKVGFLERLPRVVKQAANLVIVHIWLYYTAPLLVDDFARGGVWLYEPVAISPLRALGFGAKDDGLFCWDRMVWWRTGKHWWDTGIAL